MCTCWVSVKEWFTFGRRWPNFGPLVAKKWLKVGQNGGFQPLSEKVFMQSNSNLVSTLIGWVFRLICFVAMLAKCWRSGGHKMTENSRISWTHLWEVKDDPKSYRCTCPSPHRLPEMAASTCFPHVLKLLILYMIEGFPLITRKGWAGSWACNLWGEGQVLALAITPSHQQNTHDFADGRKNMSSESPGYIENTSE